jgi:hypothetical protein
MNRDAVASSVPLLCPKLGRRNAAPLLPPPPVSPLLPDAVRT